MNGKVIPGSSRQVTRSEGAGSASKTPAVSLARQVILGEDEYTAALSHIIKRDFFPTLPRLAATNAYLSALETQDYHAISSSIRQLSALTPHPGDSDTARDERRREADLAEITNTPYISRTPFGMAGVETPLPEYLRREEADRADRENKRRKIDTSRGLDDFQHVYTSEDNASFLEILTEDNARRKEKYSWAFEAETKAKENRLQLEQGRRRLLIEHGGYIPTDDGLLRLTLGDEAEKTIRENKNKELVAGPNGKLLLIQAKQDEKENERKSIKGKEPETSTALTKVDKGKRRATADEEDEDEVLAMILGDSSGDGQPSSSNTALIRAAPQMNAPDISEQQLVIPNALPRAIDLPPDPFPQETLLELPLPGDSHLARALNHAGLPETALINKDGQLVPARDVASGSGNGLGRGFDEKARRELIEKEVMGDEKDERSRAVPTWAYRTRNAFMFGPDADVDPLKRPPRPVLTSADLRQDPPEISHRNTRLPDDEENDGRPTGGRSSARASSPSRSRVGAAISGTPYRSNDSMPTFNNYALVPDAPSPSPEQLGPQAVSQLMTWGSLMSTPRALGEASGSTDNGPNVFKLNEPDRRDKLARKLANNASRAMKERAKGFGIAPRGLAVLSGSSRKPGSMGPPSTHGSIFDREGSVTPRRNADSLTPAGRTLLERSMGTPISASRRAGTGVGSGGGASRGRVEAMERSGGWSNLGSNSKRKEPAARSWTPSPAPVGRG